MATNLKLMIHQGAFLQAPLLFTDIRWHLMVAGYGSGKSRAIATTMLYLADVLENKRDAAGDSPRVLVGGATIGHFLTTTMIYVFGALNNSKSKYHWDSKNNVLTIGSVHFQIVSLSVPGTIKGQDVCVAIADEADDISDNQNSAELTIAALKALNERARQRLVDFRPAFLMVATTSQGQKGLFNLYNEFKKTGQGFTLVRGQTKDNTFNDPTYVESLYKTYTKEEAEVYLEGKFVALTTKMICSDFRWERNYKHTAMDTGVGDYEDIIWAQDFNQGYHRGCACIERNGVMYIVKDYEFPDIRVAPFVVRTDFPRNKIIWVPDATAKDQIMNFRKELKKYNIRWAIRSKNPSVEDTVFLVNKLLYTRRLIVTAMAKTTAEDMSRGKRGKNNEVPKGIGPRSPIHRIDAVRMAAFYMALTRPALRDIRKLTVDRHLRLNQLKEIESQDNSIIEHDGGFIEVPGSIMQ